MIQIHEICHQKNFENFLTLFVTKNDFLHFWPLFVTKTTFSPQNFFYGRFGIFWPLAKRVLPENISGSIQNSKYAQKYWVKVVKKVKNQFSILVVISAKLGKKTCFFQLLLQISIICDFSSAALIRTLNYDIKPYFLKFWWPGYL